MSVSRVISGHFQRRSSVPQLSTAWSTTSFEQWHVLISHSCTGASWTFSQPLRLFFFFFFYLPGSCLLGEVPESVVPELKITSHPHMFFFFFPLLYELGFKSWPWFSEKIKLGHSQCLICIHSYEFCNLEDVSNPGKCNHEPTAKQFPKRPFQGMAFKCPRSSVQRQRYLKYTQTYKPFR